MNSETKTKIINALEAYMTDHNVSQNDVAKFTDVNPSYLIRMRGGFENIVIGVKTVEFKAAHYTRIANYIGFELAEKIITTKETKQFLEAITALNDSKDHSEVTWIIAATGAGKTYALDSFQKKFPAEVFNVKLSRSDTLGDVLLKIADALRMSIFRGTRSAKLTHIARHLKSLKNSGLKPILNLDEAEFANTFLLCAYKDLFDALQGICPVNLIGTEDLIDKIEEMVKNPTRKANVGMPQLYRRIKFKIKRLSPIDRRYEQFLSNVEPELKKWLQEKCNNYGELTDVLTPCIRESKRTGRALTLDFVHMVLGL